MKNKNNFFNEDPPEGHAERVLAAAAKELQKLADENRKPSWAELFLNLKGMALGGGALTAVLGFWLVNRSQKESDMELAKFQATFGSDLQSGDLDLLADDTSDLDILENLDLLEEMEDV